MKNSRCLIVVGLFACACSGAGSGDAGTVEVFFSQDRAEGGEDERPGDAAQADVVDEAVDPGPVDEGLPDLFTDEAGPADPGRPDVALPDDPAPADVAPPDPGPTDPGPKDYGGQDIVATNSKTAGQYCEVTAECAIPMFCMGGEFTHAQCNPGCVVDADCATVAVNANGQCTEVVGLSVKVCVWKCGILGGTCPGDGQCDGAACR